MSGSDSNGLSWRISVGHSGCPADFLRIDFLDEGHCLFQLPKEGMDQAPLKLFKLGVPQATILGGWVDAAAWSVDVEFESTSVLVPIAHSEGYPGVFIVIVTPDELESFERVASLDRVGRVLEVRM